MSRLQANLVLLLAAVIWGLGNISHKSVLTYLDPLTAVGLTCLIGGICTLPFARFRFGGSRREASVSLLRVTLIFLIASYFQQASYATSTVTNATFLTSAASVLTPVAAWFLLRQKPGMAIYMAAGLTFAGSIFLSGGVPGYLVEGDLMALLAAASFALWTVEISRHARVFNCDFTTASAQFLGVAVAILPYSAMKGGITWDAVAGAFPDLIVLGVFSSAIAFYLQISAQRYASASHAAIIVSSECVFAAIAAALLLGERLTPAGFVGATLVLAGVVVVAMRRPDIAMTESTATAGPRSLRLAPSEGGFDDIH